MNSRTVLRRLASGIQAIKAARVVDVGKVYSRRVARPLLFSCQLVRADAISGGRSAAPTTY